MMPRKRKEKLCVKKNEKRKKAAMKKSLQCSSSLTISIPTCKINIPMVTTAKDINELYNVVTKSDLLPSVWSLTKDTTALFCHKLRCDSSQLSSAVMMTVVIQSNFEWSLSCMAHLIDKSSPAILSQPQLLQTPQNVINLLMVLDHYTICSGNNDERFIQLLDKRKGVIKDQSGKIATI